MLVRDILEDVRDVIGQCPGSVLYRRLNMAIQMLSNMGGGLWEGMTGNMNIASTTATSAIYTLPRDVLSPIAINVDNKTSFPRDRWFQYRLSSSDNLDKDYNVGWTDVGIAPTFTDMTSTSTIRAVTTDATDNGKFITIHGLNATGREIKETLTLNASANPTTTASFASVSQVVKDVTNSQVELLQVSGSLTFGRYYGNETNPEYRRIRATVASTINLSYRRRTIEVSGIDDYIPLKNPLAVIQAVRSVHYRFKERLADAQAAQADAFTLLGDEQTVRTIKNIPVGPVVENLANDPLKYPTA